MSFFRALFGKKKEEEKPKTVAITPPRANQVIGAIQELETRESQIAKKIENLRKLCDHLKQQAKEALAVNPNSPVQKASAERFLKKKAMYEKEIAHLTSAEERLTEQRIMIETQSMQVDTISVMNKANKIIPKTDPDDIASVMDEISDKIQDTEEINDLLTRPLGPTVDVGDAMAELMDEVTPAAPAVQSVAAPAPALSFPVVPTAIPVAVKARSFEEELAALETA
jgi:hypothetical protein